MAKRYTPKHMVEFEYATPHSNPVPVVWKAKEYGAPTSENLEAWRVAMNASFKPGGANAVTEGIVPHISKARILTNRHIGRHRGWTPTAVRVVVAETTMPMFEVV